MIRKLSLLALASLALAGCATSPYGYRGGGGDYYHGRASSAYGSAGYGYPGGAYGSVGYGYPGYGYGSGGYGGAYGYGSPYGYNGYAPRYGNYGYPYYAGPYRQVIVVQPQPGSPPPAQRPLTPAEQQAEQRRQLQVLRARKGLAPTPSMPMPVSAGVAGVESAQVFPGRQTQRVTPELRPDAGMRSRRAAAEAISRPVRVRAGARDDGAGETP